MNYQTLDGRTATLDLDAAVDVVGGTSNRRPGWKALIVFDVARHAFVELRDSAPDARGNSADEAEEISEHDLIHAYLLSPEDLRRLKTQPQTWEFLGYRQ